MLKIKLARFGKTKQPHYRIVVNEARDKRDGKYVANLGFYAPAQAQKELKIDLEAYKDWIKKGAQPTDTIKDLVARFESGKPFPAKKSQLSKKALAKKNAPVEEAPAPAVEAKVETSADETSSETVSA